MTLLDSALAMVLVTVLQRGHRSFGLPAPCSSNAPHIVQGVVVMPAHRMNVDDDGKRL